MGFFTTRNPSDYDDLIIKINKNNQGSYKKGLSGLTQNESGMVDQIKRIGGNDAYKLEKATNGIL